MKQYFVYLMALFYILAGVNHFVKPWFYVKMIRDFLPYPEGLVYFSGIFEILCGAGLLFAATRSNAAWATIILLVAIFPANIYMLLHAEKWNFPFWGLILRIPLQFVLIWLAYIYTRP